MKIRILAYGCLALCGILASGEGFAQQGQPGRQGEIDIPFRKPGTDSIKNVKLTDGKGVLTTEEMQYDLNQKVGVYDHGGKIVNNGSVLTSEHATYYEETKDVYFKQNVVLKDPQYDLSADSLLYNTQTQVS